jgi:glycosyltransferase involved in cell wall biosynthesis
MLKVSIMIPAYNHAKFIAQAIESSLEQDYPNLEVVVCDDNSTDDTAFIIGTYLKDSRLKIFRNESNLGKHGNYRKLLYQCATGDWAINLDGDDYFIDSGFISSAVLKIGANPKLVCVQAGFVIKDGKRETTLCPTREDISGYQYFLRFPKIRFAHNATLYRRDLACAIDAYRCDIISEDAETMLRLYLHGDVSLLDVPVAVWRRHDNSISMTFLPAEHIRNIDSLTEGVYQYALSLGLSVRTLDKWKRRAQALLSDTVCLTLLNTERRNSADISRAVNEFNAYLWANRRHVFRNPRFLGDFLIYTCLGPDSFKVFYRACTESAGVKIIKDIYHRVRRIA